MSEETYCEQYGHEFDGLSLITGTVFFNWKRWQGVTIYAKKGGGEKLFYMLFCSQCGETKEIIVKGE